MRLLNVPCWITLSRLLFLPVAVLPVVLGWSHDLLVAAAVSVLAGATDAMDGFLARKLGCTTALGIHLDLLADKLFVCGMLLLLAWAEVIPLWMPTVVIIREATVSLARLVLFGRRPPASDVLGKMKMAISMAAIVGVLLRQDMLQWGLLAKADSHVPVSMLLSLVPWAMLLAVALTVLSGANYLARYSGLAARGKSLLPRSGRLVLPPAQREKGQRPDIMLTISRRECSRS